jgi:2-dehydro-3-deoxyphosphogluconate aldolase/(4S)-4-hydroxy-2-oxoglutarate aldolase
MTLAASPAAALRAAVAQSLRRAPIVGVVRTATRQEAETQARALIAGGIELVEITFTVPEAADLVEALLRELGGEGPPWVGMGTVTTPERAHQAVAAGARFVVTPNVAAEAAQPVLAADTFFIVGALTPTEIVAARSLGADLVKVFPLPPVGGPHYLSVVRGPLADVPMLAAGGFGVDEIPAYRAAGAIAFGLAAPLLGAGADDGADRMARALRLARGEAA